MLRTISRMMSRAVAGWAAAGRSIEEPTSILTVCGGAGGAPSGSACQLLPRVLGAAEPDIESRTALRHGKYVPETGWVELFLGNEGITANHVPRLVAGGHGC